MTGAERKFYLLEFEIFRSLFSFSDGAGIVKAILLALVMAVNYLLPTSTLQTATIAASALVLLDTLTGIMAAYAEGKPRSSVAFGRVIAKSFAYFSVVIVAAVVERVILKETGLSVTLGVLFLIIAREGISILENVERISGGRFRVLRSLLGRVLDDDEEAAKEKKENV